VHLFTETDNLDFILGVQITCILFGEYTITFMSDTEIQIQVFSTIYVKERFSSQWEVVWASGTSVDKIVDVLSIIGKEIKSYHINLIENSIEISFSNDLSIKLDGSETKYECFIIQGLNRYLVI